MQVSEERQARRAVEGLPCFVASTRYLASRVVSDGNAASNLSFVTGDDREPRGQRGVSSA